MSDCGCHIEIKNKEQSRVLVILLAINAVMFFIEVILGILSESSSLIADSLDMLADATVYAIGLYAVGRTAMTKVHAAHISGIFQVLLGLMVIADVVRRMIYGSDPQSLLIICVGFIALIANIICLRLISQHKDGEVHMRASWIFSKNDVIANAGIILTNILVYITGSRFPDLVIGLVISIVVIKGGIDIIKDAKSEKRQIVSGQ